MTKELNEDTTFKLSIKTKTLKPTQLLLLKVLRQDSGDLVSNFSICTLNKVKIIIIKIKCT